jgi:hypothetical protein
MNERGGQGMDLEGVEAKTATMLSSPQRPAGWRAWESAEPCGGGSDGQQRWRKRW